MKMKLKAKHELLKNLSDMMSEEMSGPLKDKLKGKQKVTVMADDAEGLEEGLSKAQMILKKYEEMMGKSSNKEEYESDDESEMEDEEEC